MSTSFLNDTRASLSYLSGPMRFMFSANHADRFAPLEGDRSSGRIIGDNQGKKTVQPPMWRRKEEGDRTNWGYYLEHAPPVVWGFELSGPDVLTTTGNDEDDSEDEGQNKEMWDHVEDEAVDSRDRGGRRRISHAPAPRTSSSGGGRFAFPSLSRTTTIASRASRLSSFLRMSNQTHWWISLWFAATAPVIFWDVGYCFMRPRSMEGGDLHWIWAPYSIYQNVDWVYGIKALEENDGFTNAQSLLNVVENFTNMLYLYLAHSTNSPVAPLIGFSGALMTLAKTLLYWLQEYYCNFCAIGHNSAKDLLVYWIIPNGLWIVFPALIVLTLGKDIASQLRLATKVSSGKTR